MAKLMAQCLHLGLALILAAAMVQSASVKADSNSNKKESASTQALPHVEQSSTESPIADMALIDDAPEVPKMQEEIPATEPAKATDMKTNSSNFHMEQQPSAEEKLAQPHTVADFIIHPLIAFKPRQATLDELQAQGKQATTAGGSTPATSTSTWLFGSPGQALGSSFSTLAGSVSGWFNDRLAAAGQQLPVLPGLPGLVDTPVRNGAGSTSTTTQRPEIVVRLQQRPNRRRGNNNLNNRIGNQNGNGNRFQRPNRFNNHVDSLESLEEYDDVDYFNGNLYDEEFYDDEQDVDDVLPNNDDDDLSLEHNEHEDDEEQQQQQSTEKQKQKPKQQHRRRPAKTQPQRSKLQTQQAQSQRQQVKRTKPLAHLEQGEEEEEGVEVEDDDDVELENDDEEEDEEMSLPNVIYSQSSRKSPSQTGFIQNGQQSLINQIRRFTFGQTPAELGAKLRKSPSNPSRAGSGVRRPQQATLLVNRNGQTIYVAPELLSLSPGYTNFGYGTVPAKKQSQQYHQRLPASPYPQPPLTVPLRRKGRPTQYITIPWSQLGLSSPDHQSVVSLAEGIQAQPLILNIPESAISTVPARNGSNKNKRKKRPTLTAAAVPLLADASLMNIFQPPQIPPSRTGTNSNKSKPVLISAKPVQAVNSNGLLPSRIRPGTIVEKAPAMDATMESQYSIPQSQSQKEHKKKNTTESSPAYGSEQTPDASQQMTNEKEQFIIVGEDNEPGLSRHVQPAYGDARYVSYGDFQPYFDMLHQNRRFAIRKVGRALESETNSEQVSEDTDSPIVQI